MVERETDGGVGIEGGGWEMGRKKRAEFFTYLMLIVVGEKNI
jgi:hypothetical protein